MPWVRGAHRTGYVFESVCEELGHAQQREIFLVSFFFLKEQHLQV